MSYQNQGYMFQVHENTENKPVTTILEARTKQAAVSLAAAAVEFDTTAPGSAIEFFRQYQIVEVK